ncbi:MAG: aminotransferase class V-fold PLP-dependent enzyme [Planctomycetes bacterium]|nr:aminotransferase class V-fold PLP-dependent enzyme [Planctomycetota bacterium]
MPTLDSLRAACAAPLHHPSPDWMRSAGAQTMDAMLDDFLHIAERDVGHTASRETMESLLHEPPPEAGMPFEQLLRQFHDTIVHHCFRTTHPRFLAFIPGAPTFPSILADCLASNANIFAGVWKEASGAAQIELVVLDWFKQFLGYPAEARGILTGGGSEANLTALVVAREKVPFDDRGKIALYASEHRHWSIDRAAKIVGLRPEQIRPVACDADFRVRIDALREAIARDRRAGRLPWLVLANAGTTNTGSVDPLPAIADVCEQEKLWLHVDAAYGWPMTLSAEGRSLLEGIGRADSVTLDPHKWFAQPFEAGCLLVRRGESLAQAFMMRPEYMQDVVPNHDEINFCDHGIALTRRFRALKIWFSIKMLGIAWFRRLIEHGIALADYAQALLEQTGCFKITSPRKLSIVCFRYRNRSPHAPREEARHAERDAYGDALQLAIAEELTRSGRAFLSTTRLNGQSTLRLCFVSWRTTAADVDEVVRLLCEIGERLENAK